MDLFTAQQEQIWIVMLQTKEKNKCKYDIRVFKQDKMGKKVLLSMFKASKQTIFKCINE